MPTYNAEKFIKKSIDTILSQKFGEFELIIVDDKSSDATPQIIKEYEQKDQRVISICKNANEGPAASRQLGLNRCSGEFVAFVDADDWYCSDATLNHINEMLATVGADCYMFGYKTVHPRYSFNKWGGTRRSIFCKPDCFTKGKKE